MFIELCYVREIIFELITQENNVTSLLGEIFLSLLQVHFPLYGKQHEITFVNVLVHCVVDKVIKFHNYKLKPKLC